MDEVEITLRLVVATAGGSLVGLEREFRNISAGLRTHAMAALSAAVVTVSALLLYESLGGDASTNDLDPLRVIQGLAQAIGFIAAGAIFVSRGNVHNLTSAATLWLSASVGIAAGAGQYFLLGVAVGISLFVMVVLRILEKALPGTTKRAGDSPPPGGS